LYKVRIYTFDDALRIESNMMSPGKLKKKVEIGNKETRRYKEQGGPFGSGRSSRDKMDDMARIIKEMSNKISITEIDQAKNENFHRKDFRRNPNPQARQRLIKNEDQKIQSPFKSVNFIGGEDVEYFEELEEYINNLGDECMQPYLPRQDYEKLLKKENRSENNQNSSTLEDSTYEGIEDGIMVELQQKYNLSPRNKNLATAQMKRILLRGETDEATSKTTEK
jgi:hypothetical protein